MFDPADIVDLVEEATKTEYDEATPQEQKLWKTYTTEILPCTHGRGGENFWKMVKVDRLSKQKTGLHDVINITDEAFALAAIENKREGVLNYNPNKKLPSGAPRRENQNPITEKRNNFFHDELSKYRKNIKSSWFKMFDQWSVAILNRKNRKDAPVPEAAMPTAVAKRSSYIDCSMLNKAVGENIMDVATNTTGV